MTTMLVTFSFMKVDLRKQLKAGQILGSVHGQLIPSTLDPVGAEQLCTSSAGSMCWCKDAHLIMLRNQGTIRALGQEPHTLQKHPQEAIPPVRSHLNSGSPSKALLNYDPISRL